jgi:hypothetical protein
MSTKEDGVQTVFYTIPLKKDGQADLLLNLQMPKTSHRLSFNA